MKSAARKSVDDNTRQQLPPLSPTANRLTKGEERVRLKLEADINLGDGATKDLDLNPLVNSLKDIMNFNTESEDRINQLKQYEVAMVQALREQNRSGTFGADDMTPIRQHCVIRSFVGPGAVHINAWAQLQNDLVPNGFCMQTTNVETMIQLAMQGYEWLKAHDLLDGYNDVCTNSACTKLACMTYECGHRFLCTQCFDVAFAEAKTLNCPLDDCLVADRENVTDSLPHQHRHLYISRGLSMRDNNPIGTSFHGQDFSQLADAAVVARVRAVLKGIDLSSVDGEEELRLIVGDNLTINQYDLVWAELSKDADLHGVLKKIDAKNFEKETFAEYVRREVVTTVEGTNKRAIASRAIAGSIVDMIFYAFYGVADKTWYGYYGYSAPMDAVSNIMMTGLFCTLEFYRGCKGQHVDENGNVVGITMDTAITNMGEHVAGGAGGFAGSMAGAKAFGMAGAAAGSLVPGVGTATGGLVGAFAGIIIGGIGVDYALRMMYRLFYPNEEVHMEENSVESTRLLTKEESAQRAAEVLGINLKKNSFAIAQGIFREEIMRVHTDKNPHCSLDEMKQFQERTCDVLACWAIVREYYKESNKIKPSHKECELNMWVLRTKMEEAGEEMWKAVRVWFGSEDDIGRPLDEGVEKVDHELIYL